MKNQYLLYTLSCKIFKSIFDFTVKTFSKNCQCILLAKEFRLSKVTNQNKLTGEKRPGVPLIHEDFERAVRTLGFNGTRLDFKELQSSWCPLLSRFPNCPWLGPSGSAAGGTWGTLLMISSEPCYCTAAERNSTKPGLEQHPLINVCIYTSKTAFSLLSWVCPASFSGYWISVILEGLLFSTQILWTGTSSGCIILVVQGKSGLFSFLTSVAFLTVVWTLSSLSWVYIFLSFVVSFSCRKQDWAN